MCQQLHVHDCMRRENEQIRISDRSVLISVNLVLYSFILVHIQTNGVVNYHSCMSYDTAKSYLCTLEMTGISNAHMQT